MVLHMAVEEAEAGLVGGEIDGQFLERADHRNILDHAGKRHAGDIGQLEAVAVQVDRVDIVGGIEHAQPVALAARQTNIGSIFSIENATLLIVNSLKPSRMPGRAANVSSIVSSGAGGLVWEAANSR
jgi:hypothetical protein